MKKFSTFTGALLAGALVLACGGSEKPVKEPTADPEPRSKRRKKNPDEGVSMSAEIGALPTEEVDYAWKKLTFQLGKCQVSRHTESDKFDVVAGDFAVEVRSRFDGTVKLFLKTSALGDRELEHCIVRKGMKLPWPKPVGGKEGYSTHEFGLEPYGERHPVAWEADKYKETMDKAKDDLASCNAKSGTVVTAYVDTDGSVLSAGANEVDRDAKEAADCVAKVVKGLTFPSPGSFPAKFSVALPLT